MKTMYQQIEKAASPKDCRAYLQQPYFDGKRMIASNGLILAVVRPEQNPNLPEKDSKGFVPAEALKAARKKGSDVILNGKTQVPLAGLTLDRPDLGEFLKPASVARIVKAHRNKIKVGLNIELLMDLVKAINDQTGRYKGNIELWIDSEAPASSAVFVRSNDRKNYGVIMPERINQ